jgi:hypothetical protein
MKRRFGFLKWMTVVMVVALVVVGGVLADDMMIDDFTSGAHNLSRDTVGTDSYLATATGSAIGDYRMMILDVTQNTSGQQVQWGVSAASEFVSFSAPGGDQAMAYIQWDGNDSSTDLDCTTGLGGVNLSDSGSNTGIVIRVVTSDNVAKDLTFRVYTDCDNWVSVTKAVPDVNETVGEVVDLHIPFTQFSGGAGTIDWTSINAIELEIDGTVASGPDVIIAFLKSTGTLYDYGDLPLVGTNGLPLAQTGFSTSILNARHMPQGMRLGGRVDADATYNDTVIANGDNSIDFDDETGVTTYAAEFWSDTGYLDITTTGCSSASPCYLNGWIDWDQDGDFDSANERVIANDTEVDGDEEERYSFTIPSGTSLTDVRYYARFRICSAVDACDDPDDTDTDVTDGEIEDYAWDWGTPPTAVSLGSFTATRKEETVEIEWRTTLEVDTAGFNLWRAAAGGGEYVQVNPSLIPSAEPGGIQGATYRFVDADGMPGETYTYKLEELETGGRRNWYGPITMGETDGGRGEEPTALTLSTFEAKGSAWLTVAASVVGALGGLIGFVRRKLRL